MHTHKTRAYSNAEPSDTIRTIPRRLPFRTADKVSSSPFLAAFDFFPKLFASCRPYSVAESICEPRVFNLHNLHTISRQYKTLWCVFRTRTLTRPRGSLVCIFDLDIVRWFRNLLGIRSGFLFISI